MRRSFALALAVFVLTLAAMAAQAANWKKYQGEFAGDGSDCIDFDSIRTDAQGLTRFRRYVIDDSKSCGPPNQYNVVETIAVSCPAVLAAGPNRDGFPVKFYGYDSLSRRWEESGNASRQFSRVMQFVCQNRR
jgi:hypothetical protein